MTLTEQTAPDRVAPQRAWLPVAAAVTTLLLWASAFVAIRHLGESVPPGALSLGRLLVAAAALGLLLLLRLRTPSRTRLGETRRTWPAARDWPLLLACGIGWFGIYNLALNESERRIDAGTAALVVQIGPIVVALLATLFLGERMHRWLLVGMVVGFAGVLVIAQGSAGGGSRDLVGVGLAFVSALGFAVGVLAQKPLLARIPALELTWLACLIGAATCLPWAGELLHVVRTADGASLWWIVYLGLAPTALAFTTWAYALSHTDAGKLSLTTFLVPLIATGIAWALLDEVPAPLAFLGGALCIIGVALTRRGPAVRPSAKVGG